MKKHQQEGVLKDYFSEANLRSDTIDIIQYTIDLDLSQAPTQQISSTCTVDLISLMNNVSTLHLDLLDLIIDGVSSMDGDLVFEYNSPDLFIHFPTVLNSGETYSLSIAYHGSPSQDPTFGGFYFSLGYSYNIGVGFDADPHNFGRAWFPCFDNFVERSKFHLNVLTTGGRTSYCAGLRTGVETVGQDSLYTHWELNEEIPSYLASVASAVYTHVSQSFTSITGDEIPIWLAARAVDTTAMKQSFVNLIPWVQGAELKYGPFRWPRVGYVAVPFTGGAMEHATNIAYPTFAINGDTTYEALIMAHELSHHWWGDLVTCRTAEDMWLNEGWASYSESLFEEIIHGEQAYKDYVSANHKNVLLHAHENDGDWYPVSGVPHDVTYGSTVYLKGADVVHSLRGYMGDIAFFEGIQDFLESHQYMDISSEDLRDGLQAHTSSNLTSFFDNWVFAPGFPEFRLNHFSSVPSGNGYSTELSIDQFAHHTDQSYSDVPLEISFLDADLNEYVQTVIVSGDNTTASIVTPFAPEHVIINRNQKLNYAVLSDEKIITNTGSNNLGYAEMDMSAISLGSADSIWVRIENHFAAANEPAFIPYTDYYVSTDRWWQVIGAIPNDASITGKIRYYGNSGSSNYYDITYFPYLQNNGYTENDLILLYRINGSEPWTEWTDFSVNTSGSATNWSGLININNIQEGQYTWAVHTGVTGVNENSSSSSFQLLRKDHDHLSIVPTQEGNLHICDMEGKLIRTLTVRGVTEIDLSGLAAGIYVLRLNNYSISFSR